MNIPRKGGLGQSSLVLSIAQAIAQVESGGNPNALNYRNNNPGNLRSWGSMPIVSGYAKFPTLQDGWNALYRQIELNIGRGLSMYEFFAGQRDAAGNVIPGGYSGYAPSADHNAPIVYAQRVAAAAGVDPSLPLNGAPPAASDSGTDESIAGDAPVDDDSSAPDDGSINTVLLWGIGAVAALFLFRVLFPR